MSVVALNHARIGVSQVARQNDQRGGVHDRKAGIGVPQRVETGGRRDLRDLTRRSYRPHLVRF